MIFRPRGNSGVSSAIPRFGGFSVLYTEVTSDAGEMFFVKVLSDAWHAFAGEVAIGSDGANSCHR